MNKHYFTFGFNQGHDNGYVLVQASTAEYARQRMIDEYGQKWGFQYTEKEFTGQERRYQLHLVDVLSTH